MANKLWRQSGDLDTVPSTWSGPAPGKVPATAHLSAKPQPIIFRVENVETAHKMAETMGLRDENGVAADADGAVERAASSSGSTLPSGLRTQFESSLGADLSGVRVHNGIESHQAAHAVGARAYTMGQNIHFAEGQYDPSNPFGVHLLAHEVAHTVQQQGASIGFQCKLEVGTAQDALEIEADRAADQMVIAGRAEVSKTVGGQRKVMRDEATSAMDTEAAASAIAAREEMRQNPPDHLMINIGSGASQAREMTSLIQSYERKMNAGVADGTDGCVTSTQLLANCSAIEVLENYVNSSNNQGSTLGQFQAHAERLRADYAWIQGQVAGFNNLGQSEGITANMNGRTVADIIISGASGGSLEELQQAFQNANANGNSTTNSNFTAMQRTRTDLQRASARVPTKESAASAREARMRSAHNDLIHVVTAQQTSGLEGQIAGLRSAAAGMREKIELVAGMVKSIVRLGGAVLSGGTVGGTDMVNEAVSASFSIAGYLATHHYDEQIVHLNAQLRQIAATRDMSAIASARDAAAAATREWQTASQEYVDEIQDQQRLRVELDIHMRNLGRATDRHAHGNAFAIISQILSSCDQYLAQSRTTLGIGHNEEARAAEAIDAASGVNAPLPGERRQPLIYYVPQQFYHLGAVRWGCRQSTAFLDYGNDESGNRTVRQTLEALEQQQQNVTLCQSRLNQVFSSQ